MKIILLDRVEHVGEKGEVKEVKKGYFRNFLFPRGLAKIATTDEIERIENLAKEKEKRKKEEVKELQKKASEFAGKKFEIGARFIAGRKLYGSIKDKDIAEKLGIDRKNVVLDEPIKKAGEHKVKIDLGKGVKTEIIISIVSKKKKSK